MLQLLLLGCIVSLGVAEPEVEPAAAASPVFLHHDEHEHFESRRNHGDDHLHSLRKPALNLSRTQRLKLIPCSRTRTSANKIHSLYGDIRAHVSEDTLTKQYKIIERVYSPDYYEPTLILDYRYLKSGGRDYTRGAGGQILILPHGVHSHEHKDHKDYDTLIEFLRLRHLAQVEAVAQRHQDEHSSHLHNVRRHEHAHDYKTGPELRTWS